MNTLPILFSLALLASCNGNQARVEPAPSVPEEQPPDRPEEQATGENLVCTAHYRRGAIDRRDVIRLTPQSPLVAGAYVESRSYDDLDLDVRYDPPGPEGNTLRVTAGPRGSAAVSMLYQFGGDSIPAHRLAGDDGMTGTFTVRHPTSGASLEYSCVKEGAPAPTGARPVQAPRISCATYYRDDVTRPPGGARRLDASPQAPRLSSDYRSLGMSVEYVDGDPRHVRLIGTDRVSRHVAFEARYSFLEPPPAWFHSQGFTGLGYFVHPNGAELQYICSTGELPMD